MGDQALLLSVSLSGSSGRHGLALSMFLESKAWFLQSVSFMFIQVDQRSITCGYK